MQSSLRKCPCFTQLPPLTYPSFCRTGWHNIRDKLARLFGREVIDRTRDVWGCDEHGEIRAGYKPSGQPGVRTLSGNFLIKSDGISHAHQLWFAMGDFAIARFYSKFLVGRFRFPCP